MTIIWYFLTFQFLFSVRRKFIPRLPSPWKKNICDFYIFKNDIYMRTILILSSFGNYFKQVHWNIKLWYTEIFEHVCTCHRLLLERTFTIRTQEAKQIKPDNMILSSYLYPMQFLSHFTYNQCYKWTRWPEDEPTLEWFQRVKNMDGGPGHWHQN